MTTSDLWDAETAARYDDTSAFMFAPDVLDPAVRSLAELAGGGRALELAIGTGRVAVPLVGRGVPVSGVELSQPNQERDPPPSHVFDIVTFDMFQGQHHQGRIERFWRRTREWSPTPFWIFTTLNRLQAARLLNLRLRVVGSV